MQRTQNARSHVARVTLPPCHWRAPLPPVSSALNSKPAPPPFRTAQRPRGPHARRVRRARHPRRLIQAAPRSWAPLRLADTWWAFETPTQIRNSSTPTRSESSRRRARLRADRRFRGNAPVEDFTKRLRGYVCSDRPASGDPQTRDLTAGGSGGEPFLVSLETERPAGFRSYGATQLLPAFPVTVAVAVLHFHTGCARAFCDEADLDLARAVGIRFDLPPTLRCQPGSRRTQGCTSSCVRCPRPTVA